MLEHFVYPFVPGQHGINFRDIPLGSNRLPIRGGSGRNLRATLTENSIYVCDTKLTSLVLNAAVNTDQTLSLFIRTEHRMTGERHRDFFANYFVDFALYYFRNYGHSIGDFDAVWDKNSRNYREFRKGKRKGLSDTEAAATTWTGQAMIARGFSKIYHINTRGFSVGATFAREEAEKLSNFAKE